MRHILSILVENEAGALSRISGLFSARGYNIESLKQTFSCYNPRPDHLSETHCGQCYACFKRFKLFQALNVEHNFRAHPKDGPNWSKYQAAENKKRGEE